ncbi:MAG: transcription antitermination factor NusB, partial [Berryella intestinalis]|nr:transcription antitermination factor NusB [Berryella intestinalis]
RIVRMREAYAQEVIETVVDSSDMSEADRAFATLLSLGVVCTYGVLDEVINRALDRPADAFSDVRDALRISTYELIFLGKQPHAAIDQGVELVRAISPSAHGLGNAILHRIERMRGEFPFGDPNTDLDALARVYAFPKWMTRRLVEDMGAKDAATFLRVSNDPAPLFIAVNALKATDGEVIEAFAAHDAVLTPALANGVAVAGCFHVSNPRVLAEASIARLFEDGKILVSDASAQLIASRVLGDEKPASVLEVGAGRGTKTILIQSDAQRRFGSQVDLTSVDLHEFKMDLLRDRARAYGAELSDALVGNATRLETVLGDRAFETVLVDAPCSGLGTLRRHPEIRWRINKENIDAVGDISFAMLCSAAEHVKEGGRLVFSTCTVTYDENTGMVKRFLESPAGSRFALAPIDGAPCISTKLDEGSPDAHFAACFVRKG